MENIYMFELFTIRVCNDRIQTQSQVARVYIDDAKI